MCRRNANRCSVLGNDPSAWSQYAPLHPDTALVESLPFFERAVRAAAEGQVERSKDELLGVQSDAIRTWYIEHAQIAGNARRAALGRPRSLPYSGRIDPLAYPRPADLAAVLVADGHRCRYCQRPVVHKDVLKLLQAIVGKNAFPIGPTNLATHGAVLAHRAVADHVVPRKRGGPTGDGNLVTACYPCNFGKAEHTLEELGLLAPRPAVVDGWDGLHSLVPALKAQALRVRSVRLSGDA
jgi:hypothetical protein